MVEALRVDWGRDKCVRFPLILHSQTFPMVPGQRADLTLDKEDADIRQAFNA